MRRYYIVIGMFLLSAAMSLSVVKSQARQYEVRLKDLPTTIGRYQGRDAGLGREDLVYAVLETAAVLNRVYARPESQGDRVDVLITYFERGHRGFHPPEVSFVASGNSIVRSGIVRIPLAGRAPELEANMFLGKTPHGETLFLYWFGIGERWMASYYKGSANLLWNALLRRPSAASMVRLALPVVNGNIEATLATAGEFTRQLMLLLPEYLKELPVDGSRKT